MLEPPLGNALVELDEPVARPDEVGEHGKHEAPEDQHRERERQGEPGCDPGIEPSHEQPPEPAWWASVWPTASVAVAVGLVGTNGAVG